MLEETELLTFEISNNVNDSVILSIVIFFSLW
jgi:hypothetical protein